VANDRTGHGATHGGRGLGEQAGAGALRGRVHLLRGGVGLLGVGGVGGGRGLAGAGGGRGGAGGGARGRAGLLLAQSTPGPAYLARHVR
jgi:hypothetical protein